MIEENEHKENVSMMETLAVRREDSSGDEQYQFPKENFLLQNRFSSAKQIQNT